MTFQEIQEALINLRLEFYTKLNGNMSTRDILNIDKAIDALNEAIVATSQVGDEK